MRRELLKGNLDMLLLAIVGVRSAHGYAIIEELRRRSDHALDLPEGTVYPALHRLERAGFLTSHWSSEAGRRRRIYEITRRGRAAAHAQLDDWRTFSRAVANVMKEATWAI